MAPPFPSSSDLVRTYPEDSKLLPHLQESAYHSRFVRAMEADTINARPEEAEALAAGAESVLACNCCRRRKLRCSRELPVCQQCRKTGELSLAREPGEGQRAYRG